MSWPRPGNWTWEKFTEYAKKCTRYDSSGKITQYGFHGDLFSVMASAIASNMGDVVSFENNTYRLALDSPNSLEALNQVEKWMHTDRIMNAEHVYWDGPMRMFEKGPGRHDTVPRHLGSLRAAQHHHDG